MPVKKDSSEAFDQHQVAIGLMQLGICQPCFVGRKSQATPHVRLLVERDFSSDAL